MSAATLADSTATGCGCMQCGTLAYGYGAALDALEEFRKMHPRCVITGGGNRDGRCQRCKQADRALTLAGRP